MLSSLLPVSLVLVTISSLCSILPFLKMRVEELKRDKVREGSSPRDLQNVPPALWSWWKAERGSPVIRRSAFHTWLHIYCGASFLSLTFLSAKKMLKKYCSALCPEVPKLRITMRLKCLINQNYQMNVCRYEHSIHVEFHVLNMKCVPWYTTNWTVHSSQQAAWVRGFILTETSVFKVVPEDNCNPRAGWWEVLQSCLAFEWKACWQ